MADFEKYLPRPKKVKPLQGIMVRPTKELCQWLEDVAKLHRVSANKLVLAILEKEMRGK